MYYRKPATETQGDQPLTTLEGVPPSLDNNAELHLEAPEFVNTNNNGNDQISMQSQ